jgi:hypothetical protein
MGNGPGMLSAENVSWLNSTGRRYVTGTARAELGHFAQQIAEKTDWRQIREDIEVKICRGPDGSETFLLCRSASRSEKEKAMHERFSKHIEEGLQSLGRRIGKSKTALDRGQLERQIGRLLEDKATPAGIKLKWNTAQSGTSGPGSLKAPTSYAATSTSGLTNNCGRPTFSSAKPSPPSVFRKSDLCLRPIWHHKQDRIKAPILICFLAYVLWKTLQQWQSRAGLGDSPRTILTEFSRIHSADIVLPLADGSKRELRLRCVVHPRNVSSICFSNVSALRCRSGLRPPSVAKM